MIESEKLKTTTTPDSPRSYHLLRQLSNVFRKLNFNSNTASFLSKSVLDLRLFDEMQIGVYIVDYKKSAYVYVNDALTELLGIERDVMLQSDIRIMEQIVHPEDFLKVLEIIRKAGEQLLKLNAVEKTEANFKLFYRIRRPDGGICWCMQMNKVVQDGSDENLIDFGTLVCLPEHQTIERVAGYLRIGKKVNEFVAGTETIGVIATLSKRENEILTLVAKGFSSREISLKLEVSLQTVKIHRKHILKKLQVKSSIQAIRLMESEKGNSDSLFTG